jgi:site-specific DNA-adenine methylase
LAPSYALQDYICWESIDSVRAKATITCNNISVTGLFLFNDKGEFTQCITEDRYQKETDTETVRWSAEAGEYVERNGVRFPTELKAIWHEKNGDFEYFRGKITDLEYSVSKI